jgi:hypothetical protein
VVHLFFGGTFNDLGALSDDDSGGEHINNSCVLGVYTNTELVSLAVSSAFKNLTAPSAMSDEGER